MTAPTRQLCAFVAAGAVVLLLDGCSGSSGSTAAPATTTGASASTAASPKEQYLDAVNALCDALLPRVMRATHGGSTDISARQYLADWPAHRKVLAAFDTSLASVPVPPSAAAAAIAMRRYVAFADRLDAARLTAAKHGEGAWRHEVASEKNVESSPAIAARTAAGFAASCDAR